MITIVRPNGDVTAVENGEFISAYYFIPKEMLEICGAKLNSIPRVPDQIANNEEAIKAIESIQFKSLVIDAFAMLSWIHFGIGNAPQIFESGEPTLLIAEYAPYWIQALIDEKIIPPSELLFSDELKFRCFNYLKLEAAQRIMAYIVPKVLDKYGLREVIDFVDKNRCFEDFGYLNSYQKAEFARKWYHGRTKHPEISLESFKQDYMSNNNSKWDAIDPTSDFEDGSLTNTLAEKFMETLREKDRRILELRLQEKTLEEIAKELGYANHSGVLKRIRKIGKAFEEFADVDYGFDGNRII